MLQTDLRHEQKGEEDSSGEHYEAIVQNCVDDKPGAQSKGEHSQDNQDGGRAVDYDHHLFGIVQDFHLHLSDEDGKDECSYLHQQEVKILHGYPCQCY